MWYNDAKQPEKKLDSIDRVTLKLNDIEGFWETMIGIF